MEKEQKKHFVKLTKVQKDFVSSLQVIGFTWKYFNTYELIGWGSVDVSKFNEWSQLLIHVHEQGKQRKSFELQQIIFG